MAPDRKDNEGKTFLGVFILNNCVFCADAGASSEKVQGKAQGTRTKDQGKTFSSQSSLLSPQSSALSGFAALGSSFARLHT